MTPQELAELRRLCEAATPGPWEVNPGDSSLLTSYLVLPHNLKMEITIGYPGRIENSDFIAASREALPKLLDEVEKLRGLLRKARSGYMEYYDPEGLGMLIDQALGSKK